MPWIQVKYNLNFLVNKRGETGLEHFNDSKAFIEYSNDMEMFTKT